MALTDQQVRFFETFRRISACRACWRTAPARSSRRSRMCGEGSRRGPRRPARTMGKPLLHRVRLSTRARSSPPARRSPHPGLAYSLLGDDFNYMGSDGNYYVGRHPWHSDGWHPNPPHQDRLLPRPRDRDTGCLRVIPGVTASQDRYARSCRSSRESSEELWALQGVTSRPSRWRPSPATWSASTTNEARGVRRRRLATDVHDQPVPALS